MVEMSSENGKKVYTTIGELGAKIEETSRNIDKLLRSQETLMKHIEALNDRLLVLETQRVETMKMWEINEKNIDRNTIKIGKIEKELANLQGAWKMYVLLGGFSGIIGAIITNLVLILKRGV